jgi:hypothetical protein
MTNAERILGALDARLSDRVELTLYGRAALVLGFDRPPEEYALSRDVDAVLWIGQAEALAQTTNFWDAVEGANAELAEHDLYITHFFTEDQVILRPDWREHRVRLPGQWAHLVAYRLGDSDLLLSKLMRDDPLDHADARFIAQAAGWSKADIETLVRVARVPASEEIAEQFQLALARLLRSCAR